MNGEATSSHDQPVASGHQRGTALIVALLFLTLLTMLALSGYSASLLRFHVATNIGNSLSVRLHAQAARTHAIWRLRDHAVNAGMSLSCPDGHVSAVDGCVRHNADNLALYGPHGTITRFRHDRGSVAGGHAYAGASPETNPHVIAKYIIEDMGPVAPPMMGTGATPPAVDAGPSMHFYRITARAYEATGSDIRIITGTAISAAPD